MIFYLAVNINGHTKIVATQADAKTINPQFLSIDVPTDKAGLMAWIQQMLDETMNSGPEQDVQYRNQPPIEPGPIIEVEPTYTVKTIAFEDEWENMPLKLKFHFAALAMEEGRSILGKPSA